MSMFGISSSQLESLMYPQGRGQYHYGNTPVMVNQAGSATMIGSTPVAPATVATTNPTLGVTAGQTPAAGLPSVAAGGPTAGGVPAGGAGAYASVAGAAIQQIAQVASDYVGAKAKADILKSQSAIPNLPESSGVAGVFNPPALGALSGA